MEIILALVIGLAVTAIVFVLGRAFIASIASRGISDQVQQQLEPSRFDSATPDVAVKAPKNVDESETARPATPLLELQKAQAPKKARKPLATSSRDTAKAPRRPRTRKTGETTAPGPDVAQ